MASAREGQTTDGGGKAELELDRLSNILKTFNEHFGTLFTDADRVAKRIRDEIAPKVAADTSYKKAMEIRHTRRAWPTIRRLAR